MKHIVHYNSSGRIESLIAVNGPHEMNAGLTPKSGLLAAEIEGLNIGKAALDWEAIRKVIKDQRVSAPAAQITSGRK